MSTDKVNKEPKKLSYQAQLQHDLKLAQEAGLPVDVIVDLEDRIVAIKQYKHEWYKAHYTPTGNPVGRPKRGASDGQA